MEFHSGKELYTASQRMLTRYNGDGFKVEEVSYRNTQEVRTVYEVNGLGQIIAAKVAYTDKDGVVLESVKKSVFDGEGNEVLTIDPRGHRTLRRFTARGKIWEETDAPGHSIRYEYDLLDRLISMTDQRGTSGKYPQGDFSIEYVYDDLDRLIIGKLPKHRGLSEKPEVRLVYDLRGNLLKRIEADGGTTTYRYDRRNRLLEETRGSQDSTTTYTTYTDYDPLGNVVKLTEPGGGPVEFLYDSLNRKIRESYPDGGVRYYSYDKNDNLLFEEGPNGFRILYEYNALNQMVKQTDQEKGVSEYRFDEGSNLTWHKDERGVVRTSLYDEVNRLLKETDGRGGQTTYRYDLAGNLVERVDPKGTVITSEYSPTNLETRRTYAGGGESWEVSYSYDEAGILKIVKDGKVENRYNYEESLYTPDPYGLIFSDEQRGAGPARRVSYGYDQKRRLNHVGMPSGEEVAYTHNGLDQIVGMPGYITGAITYGQNSYLSGYTFANGVSLNREYDNKRRLTRMEYGLEGEELEGFTFDYDREDNVIQKNSDFFSYDGMNRLLSASLTGKEANMEYAYEGEGQTRMVRPDPLGDQVMELAGEDLTLDWGAGSLGIDLGYGYRVIKVVLKPQSLATRLTAETLEVYTALYNKEGYWDKPVEFTFERDETTGEITLDFEEVQFARYLKIHSHFYEMNEAGEALDGDATLELRGGDPFDVSILSSGRNEFYRYDAKGNREGKSHFTKDFVSYTYTYYSGSDWIKTDGRYGYTYDANGNMLERGSAYEEEGDGLTILKEGDYHRYDYDLTNRLRAVYRWDEERRTEVLVKRYTYNAAGYRILAEDALKTQVFYTFDLEGKVIERSDSDGTRNYVFLGSKVIAFKEDGKTYYYGTDHLGSTTLITDATGETVWSGAVTPFADQESSDDGESVLFTGKELDHDTGLYYFNARWYDPELGRFISEDPIRDGQNWYIYCGNNPIKYTDPTGLLFGIDDFLFSAIGNLTGLRDDGIWEGTKQNFVESWKSVGGTLNTFEDNDSIGDVAFDALELAHRLTWGLFTETIGGIMAYTAIQLEGAVTERHGDTQLIKKKNGGASSWGSKTIGGVGSLDNPRINVRDWTRDHEQGHYYQSMILGPLYYFVVGIPSKVRQLIWKKQNNLHATYYNDFYTEYWANMIAGLEIESHPVTGRSIYKRR